MTNQEHWIPAPSFVEKDRRLPWPKSHKQFHSKSTTKQKTKKQNHFVDCVECLFCGPWIWSLKLKQKKEKKKKKRALLVTRTTNVTIYSREELWLVERVFSYRPIIITLPCVTLCVTRLIKKKPFCGLKSQALKKKKKKKKPTLLTLEFQAFLNHTIYLYGSLEPTSPGGSWITTTE